jgi:hypothetical protein
LTPSEKRFINNNNINPFVFLDLITFHLYLSDTRHSASFGINHNNYNCITPDNYNCIAPDNYNCIAPDYYNYISPTQSRGKKKRKG